MDELLSEKEQIDRMRAWWSEYGYYVIGGVVLGALILFGINRYQAERLAARIEASSLYDTLTDNVTDGELEDAEATAALLAADHGNTVYAAQSKLAMARLYMDENRDEDAAGALRGLLAMDGFDQLKHVGRVRLAKILLYQDKAGDVLALLEDQDTSAFAARYAEALGDAYVALGRHDDARQSYQAALNEPVPTINTALVQLKLLDLPEESFDAVVDDDAATDGGEEEAIGDAAEEDAVDDTVDEGDAG